MLILVFYVSLWLWIAWEEAEVRSSGTQVYQYLYVECRESRLLLMRRFQSVQEMCIVEEYPKVP